MSVGPCYASLKSDSALKLIGIITQKYSRESKGMNQMITERWWGCWGAFPTPFRALVRHCASKRSDSSVFQQQLPTNADRNGWVVKTRVINKDNKINNLMDEWYLRTKAMYFLSRARLNSPSFDSSPVWIEFMWMPMTCLARVCLTESQ